MVPNCLVIWIRYQQLHVLYQVCKLLWIHIPRITIIILLSFLTHVVCWPSTPKPYGVHKKKCLSLCHDLSLGLITKAKARKGVIQKCNLGVTLTFLRVRESVKEWVHTFPSGFLRAIWRIKIPWIEVLLIPLERF
jgi:hypothetical protein